MRIKKIGYDLILVNLLAILWIVAVVLSPSITLKVIVGLSFLFFFPGYTVIAAMLPKKEGIGAFEIVALSCGMSVGVVPLIAFIVNFTTWGIQPESMLCSTAIFTFVMSAITSFRREVGE